MKLKRFIKSFINMILFVINAILWLFNINSLGELIVGVQVGKSKTERFMYGMASLLQWFSYACIIGLAFTIYWWYKGETSIAEKLASLNTESLKCSPSGPLNTTGGPGGHQTSSSSSSSSSTTSGTSY